MLRVKRGRSTECKLETCFFIFEFANRKIVLYMLPKNCSYYCYKLSKFKRGCYGQSESETSNNKGVNACNWLPSSNKLILSRNL